MSAETCGGNVPTTWEFFDKQNRLTDRFFLRDDKDADICDHVRWSLFRDFPKESYGRIIIYSYIPLGSAVRHAEKLISGNLLKNDLTTTGLWTLL